MIADGNRKGGIVTYDTGSKLYGNKNVYVGNSQVSNSTGYRLANFPSNWKPQGTGNGILLGSIDGGVIEGCKVFNNGAENDSTDGPVGIMVYDARNVVINGNESYNNKTAVNDGNGFALDRNTSNSVLEYNWSHDNYGVGLYLAENVNQPLHFGNKVRYNLSERDARYGHYAGISLWGAMHDVEVNHNRVVMPASATSSPVALALSVTYLPGASMSNVYFHDNVFQASGGAPLVYFDPALTVGSTGINFTANWYFSDYWKIIWGNQTYTSLADYNSGTGQN